MLLSSREFKQQVTRDAKVVGLFQYDVVQSLPTATSELEYVILGVRKVPGTSAEQLYICLGNAASTTGYSWVLWSSGYPTGSIKIPKVSDETIDTSTTLQNDDELFFPVDANKVYAVTGVIRFTTGTTPNIKFTWAAPAGATWVFRSQGNGASGTWESSGSATKTPNGAATHLIFVFWGHVVVAGNAGVVQLQWAQNTSDGGDTTVNAGSYITYEAVA